MPLKMLLDVPGKKIRELNTSPHSEAQGNDGGCFNDKPFAEAFIKPPKKRGDEDNVYVIHAIYGIRISTNLPLEIAYSDQSC